MRKGKGKAYGTFGELAQGEVAGQPFLFTLPVPWGSRVVFVPRSSTDLRTNRPHKKKMLRAAERTMQHLGKRTGGFLSVHSRLPESKGMASSSADITAAVRAVASSLETNLTDGEIAAIAAEVEPTDGVMYRGISAVNQQTGQLIRSYPVPPDLLLIGYDSGGKVNTEKYGLSKREYSLQERREMQEIFTDMDAALTSNDHNTIMSTSTRSAMLNERFLPKPFFSLFHELAEKHHGGVVVGHSGTVIGILLCQKEAAWKEKARLIEQAVHERTGWKPIIKASIPEAN